MWEADFNHKGKIDFGSTIDFFSRRLVLQVKGQKIVTELVTDGTVVWLLEVRDGLSWHQIAYRFFTSANEESIEK
jgi:hypothetical protein